MMLAMILAMKSRKKWKLWRCLKENPFVTAKQMAKQMSISPRKVARLIKALKEEGKIVRVGSDRKGYWEIKDL